ncbi:MAG: prepilin-type N-terminal cleavage/methylation domain-containing protein, partial [Bacillota bacterium]|nr:prepilin-type N-terminal cleavage/methylation domain-containing protein [Bacillota bacterium]
MQKLLAKVKKDKKGFTLVEVIVVLVILAILAAIL